MKVSSSYILANGALKRSAGVKVDVNDDDEEDEGLYEELRDEEKNEDVGVVFAVVGNEQVF